ncbi:MAG TPA: DUF2442 domain-containing protein [Planctomycetaceae bacterium]|nr:DUF2442 domain-containing protein [Planctomycetaceae bacterium]
MSTSTNPAKRRRSFVPTSALARSVEFDDVSMHVTLTDGRILSVPLSWFPVLRDATPEQRAQCEIGGGGVGLHWEDLDEDLSIAGLMAGVDHSAA